MMLEKWVVGSSTAIVRICYKLLFVDNHSISSCNYPVFQNKILMITPTNKSLQNILTSPNKILG